MEKLFSFGFTQLSEEDKNTLRKMVRVQRIQILKDALAEAKSSGLTEQLGDRASEVIRYLEEIVAISKQQTDLFWHLLDRWPIPFCLSRLLYSDGLHDREHKDRIVSNLSAILLFERLFNSTPKFNSATYITHTDEQGRISGLVQGVSLEFQHERFRGKRIEWKCSSGEVSVRLTDKDEPEFTLTLPMQGNPYLKSVPLTTSETMSIPIIEESIIFGKPVNRIVGDYDETDWPDKHPLPLGDSLNESQKLLNNLWPEVLEWAKSLVPAFVDLGAQPNDIRLSSSYEPGSPIFLSRIENYFLHAEDLVHEMQHQRLFLFAGLPHFKSWDDLRPFYVSPYRPDPRHLRGIIVGLHAFLTVNEMKRRKIAGKEAQEALILQMADLHRKNVFAFRTILEHEEFSELGRELFKQMAHIIAEHHQLIRSSITPETEKRLEDSISNHVAMVQKQATQAKTELKNAASLYRDWDEAARLAANYS